MYKMKQKLFLAGVVIVSSSFILPLKNTKIYSDKLFAYIFMTVDPMTGLPLARARTKGARHGTCVRCRYSDEASAAGRGSDSRSSVAWSECTAGPCRLKVPGKGSGPRSL